MTWRMVRLFLILSILLGWQSRQLDFVMAYPQAPAEMPLYMWLPQGYQCHGMMRKTHALKLIHNVYNRILSKVQKSFCSCTHVNSCQNYTLYINLHILLNI